jgi:hypothetical protein
MKVSFVRNVPMPNEVRILSLKCSWIVLDLSKLRLSEKTNVFVIGSIPKFSYMEIACSPHAIGSPESCRRLVNMLAQYLSKSCSNFFWPNVSVRQHPISPRYSLHHWSHAYLCELRREQSLSPWGTHTYSWANVPWGFKPYLFENSTFEVPMKWSGISSRSCSIT